MKIKTWGLGVYIICSSAIVANFAYANTDNCNGAPGGSNFQRCLAFSNPTLKTLILNVDTSTIKCVDYAPFRFVNHVVAPSSTYYVYFGYDTNCGGGTAYMDMHEYLGDSQTGFTDIGHIGITLDTQHHEDTNWIGFDIYNQSSPFQISAQCGYFDYDPCIISFKN